MNIAEEKLSLLHEIDDLSEESLIKLRRIIFKLKIKQKKKEKPTIENDISALGGFFKDNKIVLTDDELCKPVDFKSVWLGIAQWREQAQFQEDDEVLTDEMIASWRDKSSGRDFSWNG